MSNIAKISLFVVVLSIAILLWSYKKSATLKEQVQKLSSQQIQYSIGMYEYSHLKAFAMQLDYKTPEEIPEFFQLWNGVLGSNLNYWYDRIENKVLPRLAYLGTNLRNFRDYDTINDESLDDNWFEANEHTVGKLAMVIQGYFKGINLACRGTYLEQYYFIWNGLSDYINSGQYAERHEVVQVGQFITRDIAEDYLDMSASYPGYTYLKNFGRQSWAGNGIDFDGFDVLIPPVDTSLLPAGVNINTYYLNEDNKPFQAGISYYETYQYATTNPPPVPMVQMVVPGIENSPLHTLSHWLVDNVQNGMNNGAA